MIPDDHTDRPPRCWRQFELGGAVWRCDENTVPGSTYCAEHLIERHGRTDQR